MGMVQARQVVYGKPSEEEPVGPQHTRPYRSVHCRNGELAAYPCGPDGTPLKTSWEWFAAARARNGSMHFTGTRTKNEDGSLGDFAWRTYDEVGKDADSFAAGLVSLEACPSLSFEDEKRASEFSFLGIFSRNREEWMIAALAGYRQAFTLVPLYETLGPETVRFVINQTKLKTVCVEGNSLNALVAAKPECPSLELAILFDAPSDEVKKKAEELGLKLMTVPEVIEEGAKKPVAPASCDTEQINTVCYTSGTSGTPKGAMLPHRCFASNIAALDLAGSDTEGGGLVITPDDVHLSYLPLAHVFERLVVEYVVFKGARIAFYGGDTQKLLEDATLLKPTLFISVPRLYNRIFDKVTAKVKGQPGWKQMVFNTAVTYKTSKLRGSGVPESLLDSAVFKETKMALGGRVKLMATGSAPLAANVHEFLKVVLCCPILEGYGLTETCAATCVTSKFDPEVGHVGSVLPHAEVKLVSVEEMGYTVHDKNEQGEAQPRGEIRFKGNAVFAGYFRDAEKTKEAFDDQGWFRTGDIGLIRPNGAVKILDRAKNIFKLSHGEYVAPEKIENLSIQAPLVAQAFVYGYSDKNNVVLVAVPDADEAKKWAAKAKKEAATVASLCEDAEFEAAAMEQLQAAWKAGELKGFEKPKAMFLSSEAFSAENDLLTPTFKLKRHVALKKFKMQIDALYAKIGG
uniref:Long-chain acyl-CoA synthetase n=2 Tax=Chromera velia TaxID=505693 RepID=A0A2K8DNG0_9ALVE|nr:Long-chain acyl-CoA synthetase [Chromera velia]|mmetsp:Transcript_13845/g.27577  ORF Transcript_13845/g.27577 Transcript_13845/m.27577 type:complete len:686 (-) Transcript_13845:35-2092(-)|eukprot:Cvel_29920.t1-p1 / transcript=Cvel_29920.t1 / gene=Cvel_29920 / organism=Chromera_velia_CCMP2878 / gene_product=Long chain acyl-CoA synthetase 7, peroxisomal, putative / transcript_product=Long chain acyl-CoA synthetase 7, peroxisomal, putative / location=Cvel_scaffold4184:4540-9926(-) / protein_length=685 / sequence_SO=supercontig / SO=protein_coding / is_pseudo=false